MTESLNESDQEPFLSTEERKSSCVKMLKTTIVYSWFAVRLIMVLSYILMYMLHIGVPFPTGYTTWSCLLDMATVFATAGTDAISMSAVILLIGGDICKSVKNCQQTYLFHQWMFAGRATIYLALIHFTFIGFWTFAAAFPFIFIDAALIMIFKSKVMIAAKNREEKLRSEEVLRAAEAERQARDLAVIEEREVNISIPGVSIIGVDGNRISTVRLVGTKGDLNEILRDHGQRILIGRRMDGSVERESKRDEILIDIHNVD